MSLERSILGGQFRIEIDRTALGDPFDGTELTPARPETSPRGTHSHPAPWLGP